MTDTKEQKSKDAAPAAQDLPANHPNDPTETTLTQEAAPDDQAQASAQVARLGGDVAATRARGRGRR